MSRYEAFIDKNWREHGLAHVIVTRIRNDHSADYGVFLTDVWCLGVKDAFGENDVPETSLCEMITDRLPESMREPIQPACAKKLIEGALAYAAALGFSPHRDFRKARRVLSGIDSSLCPTEFTYGRDGRPCYARGPDDSDERAERVLAMLDARVGPDGYDYHPLDDEEDDVLANRAELIDWLDAEPEDVPRFYALSGMVTALHVCPDAVSPAKLMEALWGPEGRVWKDADEVRYFSDLLGDYWDYVGDLVSDVAAADAPPEAHAIDIWSEDFPKDDPLPLIAASMEWAAGFLRATELWPEAWEDALERPDLAEHWDLLASWARFEVADNRERIRACAEGTPPRTLATSINALARALRPSPPSGPA